MECAYESWNYNCSFMMRILENLSARTMQRINWGLFSRAHCYTPRAQENGKGANEAFSILCGTCTHIAVCTHTRARRYLLPVTFSLGDTFTQSFLALNSQRTTLFTRVVMFFLKKQTPIKSKGLNSQLRRGFLRLCGF